MGRFTAFFLFVVGGGLALLGFIGWFTQCEGRYCTLAEQALFLLPLIVGVLMAFFSLAALVFYWFQAPVEERI